MNILYPFLAVSAGLLFAVQGPVNSNLGRRTNTFFATSVSFLGGLIFIIILCALDGFGTIGNISQAKLWMLLGGLYGAFGVCVSVTSIPVLGVALTLMANMFGQLITGCVLDRFGWMGVDRTPVTPLRIVGIAAVALGIYLIFLDKRKNSAPGASDSAKRLPMLLLAFSCGITGGMQSPTNAALSALIGSLEGTLISFLTGFIAIAIITLFVCRGKMPALKGKNIEPWMYSGGLYGVAAIFLNTISVGVLGAALLTAGSTLGQLLGGVIIDSTGFIQSEKVKISTMRLSGVAAVALGVVLVTIAKLH